MIPGRSTYYIRLPAQTAAGFTLIELLVVIAIIGLLASTITASLSSARAKANDASRLSSLRSVRDALELYNNDNGRYPSTSNGWRSTCATWGGYANDQVAPGLIPTYLPAWPKDPDTYYQASPAAWKCCYLYRSDGVNYKLLSHDCPKIDYNFTGSMMDPRRDGGATGAGYCAVDPVPGGTAPWALAVYTTPACTW